MIDLSVSKDLPWHHRVGLRLCSLGCAGCLRPPGMSGITALPRVRTKDRWLGCFAAQTWVPQTWVETAVGKSILSMSKLHLVGYHDGFSGWCGDGGFARATWNVFKKQYTPLFLCLKWHCLPVQYPHGKQSCSLLVTPTPQPKHCCVHEPLRSLARWIFTDFPHTALTTKLNRAQFQPVACIASLRHIGMSVMVMFI